MRTTITIAAAMSLIWSMALAGAAGLPGRDNPAGIDKPAVPAPSGDTQALSQEDLVKCCKDAQIVFLANVKAIEHGQTNSMPPHIFSTITFEDVSMLKGKEPPSLGFSFTNVPGSAGVTTGANVIAAAKDDALLCVAPATEENLAAVKKAIAQATTQADQQAMEKLVAMLSAKAPKDWTVSVEKGKVAPLYWPEGSGSCVRLLGKEEQNPAAKGPERAYLWIMDREYVGTLKEGENQTKPATELGKWRGHRVFQKKAGHSWETLAQDVMAALKATDEAPATRPAVEDVNIRNMKEAERIIKAELAKSKSTYGTRDELEQRLKAVQDQRAKLEAESKVGEAACTQPATQPATRATSLPVRAFVPPELYPN
jgi:hypothetical protein